MPVVDLAASSLRAEPIHSAAFRRLTRRQREVGACVLLGLGRQEIAARMEISPRTVDTHRLAVFSKLRCKTDVELVWRAIEIGWLELPRSVA